MYQLARRHFPKTYLDLLKLRMPTYVKLVLTNVFPRSQLSTHLGRAPALYCRPFPQRALPPSGSNREFLDLFQMRRCQEDLAAFARAPRLHLRRNGHVPASLPAGGGTGRISARGRPRRRSSSDTGGHSLLDTIGH